MLTNTPGGGGTLRHILWPQLLMSTVMYISNAKCDMSHLALEMYIMVNDFFSLLNRQHV